MRSGIDLQGDKLRQLAEAYPDSVNTPAVVVFLNDDRARVVVVDDVGHISALTAPREPVL